MKQAVCQIVIHLTDSCTAPLSRISRFAHGAMHSTPSSGSSSPGHQIPKMPRTSAPKHYTPSQSRSQSGQSSEASNASTSSRAQGCFITPTMVRAQGYVHVVSSLWIGRVLLTLIHYPTMSSEIYYKQHEARKIHTVRSYCGC